MIRHLYTLQKICGELQFLRGTRVIECFSQDRNSVIIELYDNVKMSHISFSTDSRMGSFFLRDSYNRANRNSVDLFTFLNGQTIESIVPSESDRLITIGTQDFNLLFILFGASKNNLIIKDKHDKIIDAFKNGRKQKDEIFILPDTKVQTDTANLTLIEYLSKHYPYLGKYYAEEFIEINNLDGKMLMSGFDDLNNLIRLANEFKSKVMSSDKYYLLKDKPGNLLFSLTELNNYEVLETFDSVCKGVERRIRKELIEGRIDSSKTRMMSKIDLMITKLNKSIIEIEDNAKNKERSDKYRKWADLLLSSPFSKEKARDYIELDDYSGNRVRIILDPKITVIENANKYFEKAKDSEKRQKIKGLMHDSLIDKMSRLNNLKINLSETDNMKRIEKLKEENPEFFGDESKDSAVSKYRVFDLGEGYTLYVGKNAANNDELTMRFAKPNDLWFHARGSSGSHAVLRLNKDDKPPKQIIKKAAAVAAYYSGAKNAKYVPVCYTYKKYVNKPRGANPGSVTLSREEVVMVEPGLPQ